MGLYLISRGQAVVEYLLLVVFLIILTSKLALSFTDFMRENLGNLGHVVSLHLTVGVCPKECFYGDYMNGARN
ncbi:MAG: hypothetical protein ACJAS4_000749 [Bacteriovoracaceae bacterium]|jgi:hypothetical protein